MIEIKYKGPRSVARSRRRLSRAKKAMSPVSSDAAPQSHALGDLQQTAASLVQQYPLASVGVAAGAAFLLVRVQWLREAALTLLTASLKQYKQPSPPPPHD